MAIFRMNLDDFSEEIFHEMEEISDGGKSHVCDIEAYSAENAAEIVSLRLMNFFKEKFGLKDKNHE